MKHISNFLHLNTSLTVKIHEDPGTEPDHTIGMKLFASQSRLDYMGTSVLMGRVSSFGVTLRDEWKLKQCAEDDDDATRRYMIKGLTLREICGI